MDVRMAGQGVRRRAGAKPNTLTMLDNPDPTAPTPEEGLGTGPQEAMNIQGSPDNVGTPVQKGHSKNPVADPSRGTANPRDYGEAQGASRRIRPATRYPQAPQAAATQARGRIITTRPAVMQDQTDYPGEVGQHFQAAPQIAQGESGPPQRIPRG